MTGMPRLVKSQYSALLGIMLKIKHILKSLLQSIYHHKLKKWRQIHVEPENKNQDDGNMPWNWYKDHNVWKQTDALTSGSLVGLTLRA